MWLGSEGPWSTFDFVALKCVEDQACVDAGGKQGYRRRFNHKYRHAAAPKLHPTS